MDDDYGDDYDDWCAADGWKWILDNRRIFFGAQLAYIAARGFRDV